MDDETVKSRKIPDKFGRYEIKTELGRGGMATVYRAYDPLFEREVAIKVLPPEFLHDPQFRARFEREAKIIAALEHPAIVPVYDVGEADGLPYFVMRYMHGGSLADKLKEKGAISIEEAAHIIRRLAPALDEAHKKGIIHRDLKPGNILFDHAGEPYLSDFGIAKLRDSQVNVTGSAIIGTPAYMSPEQAQGEPVDGRSDIYALGAILYKALSGKFPYEADTPMGLVLKHITDPIPDILQDNPSLPPATSTVIYRAMAKRPDDRFQTVAELANALDALVQGKMPTFETRTHPAQHLPEPQPEAKKTKKLGWILGGIAALLLLCAAGGLLFGKTLLPIVFSPATATPSPAVSPMSSPTPETAPISPTPPPPSATPLPPTPTETPAPAAPILGGADKIAFIANKNVWMMNVDGSELIQLTSDNTIKTDLHWLPDGKTLTYISGKCVWSIEAERDIIEPIVCYDTAQFVESFSVSPNGAYAAISMNRELYIVPFDLDLLSKAKTRASLMELPGCLVDKLSVKDALWSNDSTKVAIKFLGVNGNNQVDTIRILDVSACLATDTPIKKQTSQTLPRLDEFPGTRFTMSGYNSRSPFIPDFDWDGGSFFVMNTYKRNDGFGYLYSYNSETHRSEQLSPFDSLCCYRDARFSPNGDYIAFAYQDIRLGAEAKTQLYYVRFGSLNTGATYEPLPLPEDFFKDPTEAPQFALRPAP